MEILDLPGYQILHEIGKGAFGRVYKAMGKNRGNEVAVKYELGANSGLSRESMIMKEMNGVPGFPKHLGFKKEGNE
jgi:serine/threonine protein kinase